MAATERVNLLKALKKVGLGENLTLKNLKIFTSLLDSLYDVIVLLDKGPSLIYVSKNYEAILGLKPEEVLGRSVVDLVKEGKFQGAPSLKVLETKKPYSVLQKTKNGTEVLVTANPVFDDEGNIILIIDNIRDVTDLNRLKEESLLHYMERMAYEREALELRARSNYNNYMIVRSKQMMDVVEKAISAATVDASVLITGESGVGKDVVAKFIHASSSRSSNPFIQINCSAIPENLFESELFGYEDGAFSGARRKGKPGLIEIARGGTLFLDEIGEMPLSLQSKLLCFLQEKQFYRVGGVQKINTDVRIIAATNCKLEQRIKQGKFRSDLYYRLNVIPISIAPLKERQEDIVPLAIEFIKKYNDKYNRNKYLTLDAQSVLYDYSWPGNVRELENTMERLVILTEGEHITAKDIQSALGEKEQETFPAVSINHMMPLTEAYQQVERQLLEMAIQQFNTNRQVAKALNISHPTVSKKLKEYGLEINKE